MAESISIGDHIWLGAKSMFLEGVFGAASVIGNGSVVTKSFEANSVTVTNPAKIVKSNVIWTRSLKSLFDN